MSGQRSIKDMLQRKQGSSSRNNHIDEDQEKGPIKLPEYLNTFVDIRPSYDDNGVLIDSMYFCTDMAKVYFRESSNIDHIMQLYLKINPSNGRPLGTYSAAIMRSVISHPTRRAVDPYQKFRFRSVYEETVAKTLLINPGIQTNDDLTDLVRFQNKHQLKFCSISMGSDNPAYNDSLRFLSERQKQQNKVKYPTITKKEFKHAIERPYYERNNLIENIQIDDTSIGQLEEISNFMSYVYKVIEEDEASEAETSNYKAYAKAVLKMLQENPGYLVLNPGLKIDPKYNLICNKMSHEEEDEAMESLSSFYSKTNANNIRKRLRDKPSKEDFYEQYKNCDPSKRKHPPFQNLAYDPPCDEHVEEPTEQAGPSGLNYKVEQRCLRNTEPPPVSIEFEDDDSSKASEVTILQNVAGSVDSSEREMEIPQFYFEQRDFENEMKELIVIVCGEKRFVSRVKLYLQMYKMNFEELWKKNKVNILVNFVHHFIETDPQKILSFVSKCGEDVQSKTRELVRTLTTEGIKEIVRQESVESLTELLETEHVEEQFEEVIPTEDDFGLADVEMISLDNPIETLSKVPIKLEPYSPLTAHPHVLENSDVMCMGALEHEIIILDDSDTQDASIIEDQKGSDSNPYLDQINTGTQDIGDDVSPEGLIQAEIEPEQPAENIPSVEILSRFQGVHVGQLEDDRNLKQQNALKENVHNEAKSPPPPQQITYKKRPNRPGPRSSKKPKSGNLEYVDDDDDESLSGNDTSSELRDVLNHDFSVFLSSQLNNARPYQSDANTQSKTTSLNSFTFSKQPNNAAISATTKTCFVANLNQVVFQKNTKFELQVNLPQFNMFGVKIRDKSIESMLNITSTKYKNLISLLNLVDRYDFNVNEPRRIHSSDSVESYVIQQLDLFFSSQVKLKTFDLKLLNTSGELISASVNSTPSTSIDLSSALSRDTLSKIRELNRAKNS